MAEDRIRASVEEARRLAQRSGAALRRLERCSQVEVDWIVQAMAAAAGRESMRLAEMACEETGFGNARDKHAKNELAFLNVYEHIRGMRTAGVISRDDERRVIEIAAPMGVVAAVIPSTNPTSTTIFKALVAVKARNTVVFSPHPSALGCIRETVKTLYEAGRQAGLPEDALLCMETVTADGTSELMGLASVIIATGGAGLVRAAYSSGKPAFGVGPGNVPAYVHADADPAKAARDILAGKCFDNGTVCASEQAVVVDKAIASEFRQLLRAEGAYLLSVEEAGKVAAALIVPGPKVNPELVGKSAAHIAARAGVAVPEGTRCLVAECSRVGPDEPLSIEKLSPVLAFYEVADWHEGCLRCKEILNYGGLGHTLAIHARDEGVILAFGLEKPASRIIVNTSATHGAVGLTTALPPSMTLGCGAAGGNITSDNLTPLHLLDIKRIAYGLRELPDTSRLEAPVKTEAAPLSRPAGATAQVQAVSRGDVEKFVDSFLKNRPEQQCALPQAKPRESAPVVDPAGAGPGEPDAQPPKPAPPPPAEEAPAAEFVSEWDVRQAINDGRTITIDERTIITPLARELAEREGVFVLRGSTRRR